MSLNRALRRLELPTSTIEEEVLALQWAQLKHDDKYHKEIVLLPVGDRMKHFALHMAKYSGHLAQAIESHDDRRVESTLVDAFIISVASANTLGFELGKIVGSQQREKIDCLKELGLKLVEELGHRRRDPIWLGIQFARSAGRLAKACESLDHVESYPFREEMRDSIVDIFKLVVAEASLKHLDLVTKSKDRLEGIESRHMFNPYYGKAQAEK